MSLSEKLKPICIKCGKRDYKGPSYSTIKGYLCEKDWIQSLKEQKDEKDNT